MDSFELDRLADDGNPNVDSLDSKDHSETAYMQLSDAQRWANFIALNEAMGA
jgi:hypothetical protein